MTDEKMRDLVKECGLDWQCGYSPLFDGDTTNRYAVLIGAVVEAEREACAKMVEENSVAHTGFIETIADLTDALAKAIRAR